MTGTKISQLAAAAALAGTETVPVVQNGVTVGALASAFGGAGTFLQSGTGATSRTVQNKLRETVSVKDFGAVGDGTTDDTAALQAAINAVNAVGGGIVNCTGGRWLIDSANLNIKKGVYLVGPWSNFGRPGADVGDFSATQSALIVNSSRTIILNDRDCGIQGLVILRKGLTAPTNIRTAVDAVTAFAGTAITIGDGIAQTANDCWLSNLFIAGFAQAITSNFSDRSRISYISGDNLAGIYITKSFDMQHLSHVHFWPFVTSGFNPVAYAVSGAVNNGSGLVRLTIATSVLQTGDRVTVTGVGGATGAVGPFTATVISPTSIDLQGSTFGGAYTSGGTVYLSAWYRSGVGINFDTNVDWGQLDTCFTYNYAVGIKVNSSDQVTPINCGTDAYFPAADTSLVGIWITGTSAAAALVGCKTASQGVNLKIDTTATNRPTVHATNHRSWGAVTYAVEVSNGWASFANSEVQTGRVIRVDDAALGITFLGGDLTGATFSYQSAISPRPSYTSVKGVSPGFNPVVNAVSGSNQVGKFEGHNSTPTANDTIFKSYVLTDSSGAQVEVIRESYRLTSVTAGAVTSQLFWALSNAGVFSNVLAMSPTALFPLVNGGMALGGIGAAWSNLFTTSYIRTVPTTVAGLTAAASAGSGARHYVSDATQTHTAGIGAIVVGGGANSVPVVCDGANWRIG